MLAFGQLACTSMVPLDATDAESLLAAIESGDHLSVLDANGATTELVVTAVGADFIEGTAAGDQRVRMAAAEMQEVRQRRLAPGKALGLGAGVTLLLFMQTASEWGSLEW
ncbi:MAG TPA: hypothetical protein VF405_09245 [Gammaproteobacteria bacterium]